MIIETERLVLREFEISDAMALFNLNANSMVLHYTGDVPFTTLKDSEQFIQNYSEYSEYGYGRWAVILKSNNEFIGWCGLKYHSAE